MSGAAWLQLLALLVLLAISTPLLGSYMAKVYGGAKAPGDRFFGPIERAIYRVCGVDPETEQRCSESVHHAYSNPLTPWASELVKIGKTISLIEGDWASVGSSQESEIPAHLLLFFVFRLGRATAFFLRAVW